MRFDLEDDVMLIVKADDTRIVLEHAYAPVVVAKRFPNPGRSRKNRLFQQIIEMPFAVLVSIRDATSQRFVAAMFAPGLSDRLQLDVRRIAIHVRSRLGRAKPAKIRGDAENRG